MENIAISNDIILSVEKIIDLIRSVRNALIKDFLVDENLRAYFASLYRKELSLVKMEFLKRDLKDLLISPVDLIHYASLIRHIRDTNSASLAEGNHELFYQELETIFKKYNF